MFGSFKLPKWLLYLISLCTCLAGGGISAAIARARRRHTASVAYDPDGSLMRALLVRPEARGASNDAEEPEALAAEEIAARACEATRAPRARWR